MQRNNHAEASTQAEHPLSQETLALINQIRLLHDTMRVDQEPEFVDLVEQLLAQMEKDAGNPSEEYNWDAFFTSLPLDTIKELEVWLEYVDMIYYEELESIERDALERMNQIYLAPTSVTSAPAILPPPPIVSTPSPSTTYDYSTFDYSEEFADVVGDSHSRKKLPSSAPRHTTTFFFDDDANGYLKLTIHRDDAPSQSTPAGDIHNEKEPATPLIVAPSPIRPRRM